MSHKPAYLIAGGDWPKVEAAAARLRSQFPDEAVEQITVTEEIGDEIVAACNSLGLLGGERLVLVRGAEALTAEQTRAIATYLEDPTPDTCLALFGGDGIAPDGPLAAAVSAAGDVRFFDPPDEKEAARWVVKRFGESGISCSPAVARRLVELAGEEIGDLALEVEKVVAYCGGSEPDVETVDLLVVGEMDIKPWDVTDAWGRRDAGRVIELATAGIERPDDVHRTLAQIANHVRRVRRALLLLERGANQAEVAKQLGMKPFPAKKLCEQARRFSDAELADAVVRLARLDEAVKGGSRLDPRLELELALAEISGE